MINSLSIDPENIKFKVLLALRPHNREKIFSNLLKGAILLFIASLCFVGFTIFTTYFHTDRAVLQFKNTVMDLNDSQQTRIDNLNTNTPVDITKIANSDLFGAPAVNASQKGEGKAQTKLPLSLVGTFVEGKNGGYAIIEDGKKKVQDVFNINEDIFGAAKLVKIFPDKVEISRDGVIEILALDENSDSSTVSSTTAEAGDTIMVDEKELTQALDNLPLLLTQARAVPYFKEGKSVGLRLFAIKPGSLYEKVGLQNGDILKAVNGNSLADVSQGMKLFETLKSERSISVIVERNREEKELHYQIN